MIKNSITILIFIALGFSLVSCSKDTPVAVSKKDSTKRIEGIYGHIQLYNEYGEKDTNYSDITGKALQTSTGISNPSSSRTDRYLFPFSVIGEGIFSLSFTSDNYGYGRYEMHKIDYRASDSDSLPTFVMSKTPPARVRLNEFSWSEDKKMIYINRSIDFTDSTGKSYSVTTHYFLGKDSLVCDTSYKEHFIAGVTKGSSGTTDSLIITQGIKDWTNCYYIVAYVDNLHYSSYFDKNGKEIFPNLGGKSKVLMIRPPITILPSKNWFNPPKKSPTQDNLSSPTF